MIETYNKKLNPLSIKQQKHELSHNTLGYIRNTNTNYTNHTKHTSNHINNINTNSNNAIQNYDFKGSSFSSNIRNSKKRSSEKNLTGINTGNIGNNTNNTNTNTANSNLTSNNFSNILPFTTKLGTFYMKDRNKNTELVNSIYNKNFRSTSIKLKSTKYDNSNFGTPVLNHHQYSSSPKNKRKSNFNIQVNMNMNNTNNMNLNNVSNSKPLIIINREGIFPNIVNNNNGNHGNNNISGNNISTNNPINNNVDGNKKFVSTTYYSKTNIQNLNNNNANNNTNTNNTNILKLNPNNSNTVTSNTNTNTIKNRNNKSPNNHLINSMNNLNNNNNNTNNKTSNSTMNKTQAFRKDYLHIANTNNSSNYNNSSIFSNTNTNKPSSLIEKAKNTYNHNFHINKDLMNLKHNNTTNTNNNNIESFSTDNISNTNLPNNSNTNSYYPPEKVYDITKTNKFSFSCKESSICKDFAYFQEPNCMFRKNMEDLVKCIENFKRNFTLFTLYDGHGGDETARYVKDHFPKVFNKLLSDINIEDMNSNTNNSNNTSNTSKYLPNNQLTKYNKILISNLKLAFKIVDNDSKVVQNTFSGATGLVCIIYNTNTTTNTENNNSNTPNKRFLICANVGDSRAVLVSNTNVKRMTKDHKGSDLEEIKRVQNSGGSIVFGRVQGELIVTRAFGDHRLKSYGVSNIPYISLHEISNNDKYLVMASDGIWDVIEDDEIFGYAKNCKNSEELSKYISKMALAKGTRDNISCVVVKL